jgi:RimJ/RimL family protein N-acetyltransferase
VNLSAYKQNDKLLALKIVTISYGGEYMMIGRLVRLSSWEIPDVDTYVKWIQNPEIARLTHMVGRPISRREIDEEFSPYFRGQSTVQHWAIIDRKTNELIGKIHWEECLKGPDVYELGIVIGDSERWRIGYGAEACLLAGELLFRELKAHKVMYLCAEYNTPMIELGIRGGFKEEGRIRDRFYVNGRYWDGIWLGLLKTEYDSFTEYLTAQLGRT